MKILSRCNYCGFDDVIEPTSKQEILEHPCSKCGETGKKIKDTKSSNTFGYEDAELPNYDDSFLGK